MVGGRRSASGDSQAGAARPTAIGTPDDGTWSPPSRAILPIILIRGFGGLSIEDERRVAYQGFNDGTVYPQKRGENYIYEGMILRFLKGDWSYQDATNVVGYYPAAVTEPSPDPASIPADLRRRFEALRPFFTDPKGLEGSVVIDPAMALALLGSAHSRRSLWVLRYYDFSERKIAVYARALERVIDLIRALTEAPKVNVIAHSMGGLIVREAIQTVYARRGGGADACINKVVTLGTPHRGIAFQVLRTWLGLEAADELKHFSPDFQENEKDNPASYKHLSMHFPLERFLTVVGTNYHTYGVAPASWLNRLFSERGEFGLNYNRSDGLVKQAAAQIDGAPRTFVHKCHGGPDSLVTAREAFEIATRFFFGNVRVRLRLLQARVSRGKDLFGKSEFFLGVSVKPRGVDFELFHQSAEAENCYGPFHSEGLDDERPAFGWAGLGRLIWEGYLDVRKSLTRRDVVFRLDFYLGERDLIGIGFSDNVILRKQYYLRALLADEGDLQMYRHQDERFAEVNFEPPEADLLKWDNAGWPFNIEGPGFEGTLRVEFDRLPEEGQPTPVQRAEALRAD